MVRTPKRELKDQLDAHFATLRSSSLGDALRRGMGNWPIYAAVTGSAMAMATNASADIIYSGFQYVTAGPIASVTANQPRTAAYNTIHLKNGTGAPVGSFGIGVGQFNFLSDPIGRAALGPKIGSTSNSNGFKVGFLVTSSNGLAKQLNRSATISSAAGNFLSGVHSIVRQFVSSSSHSSYGWTAGKAGFAGFAFTTTNGQKDYGWIQLVYGVGSNTLANQLTAIDWAYDASGNAISAGEGETPEPSTGALALLAAGAAGVAALRRRRKTSA
jgi:hypothetical protein